MPLLEYRCRSCGKTSEQLVLAGDVASKPACPSCGSRSMSRLLSRFSSPTTGRAAGSGSFDPETACGGGPCGMPDVCGAEADSEDF